MKKLAIAVMIATSLSGCASESELRILADSNAQIVASQMSVEEIPTLSIRCGEKADSCKGLDVQFIHPNDRRRPVVNKIRGTNDVIAETMPSVLSTITWVGGAFLVTDALRDISDNSHGNSTTTTNTVSGKHNSIDNSQASSSSTARDTFTNSNNRSTADSNNTSSEDVSHIGYNTATDTDNSNQGNPYDNSNQGNPTDNSNQDNPIDNSNQGNPYDNSNQGNPSYPIQ